MKRFLFSAIALIAMFALTAPPALAADDEQPIITFKSNAYNEYGESNKFTIMLSSTKKEYFDIDFGFGKNEVEVEPATFDTEAGAIKGTFIPGRVSKDGIVKIYGDASLIDIFEADGCYITDLDIDACKNLEILSLKHNQLKALDLTPFTKMQVIYMTDNPFTKETPLKIGAPKPDLQILEVDIIEHFDQAFNLSDYPALVTFDGYHNLDIRNIDPTGCPELMMLSLDMTNVATVDVSKNPKLIRLNVADTKVTSIDLSHNAALQHFIGNHSSGNINTGYKISTIDLTHNPELTLLNLNGNGMKQIDLSKNTKLAHLSLRYNNLTSIDLSKCTELYSVDLLYNDLDFSTLPFPQDTWGEYFYEQNPMPVARSLASGAELNLAKRVNREGTQTTAKVYRQRFDGDPSLLEPELYKYSDGVITFNQAIPDSVFVSYSNNVLTEYNMTTTPFMVKEPSEMGKPSKIVTLTLAPEHAGSIQLYVGMAGATYNKPKTFQADLGNGTMKTYTSTSDDFPSSPSIYDLSLQSGSEREITIWIPEGEVMTALKAENLKLKNADVTQARELRKLEITVCGLDSINLAYNRCLTDLNLLSNNLTKLDLQGIYAGYEKNVLSNINVSYNKLTECNIIATRAVRSLNLAHNALTEFSLKDYDNISNLDLSYNQLAGEFNLSYLVDASSISLRGNHISRVVYDAFSNLQIFDLRDNDLTIETLPYFPSMRWYYYAPQNPLQLLENAPAVNLTDQDRVLVDGKGTTFVWRQVDTGRTLTEGVDIQSNGGAVKFLNTDLGRVFCEMTNPGFPAFTGTDVFRTTDVNVVGPPTNVVATFTTLEDSHDGNLTLAGSKRTALYVDWRGDGTEYLPYAAETTYVPYDGIRTFAGAKVKVYTYEEATDISVFSLNRIALGDFDATPLTGLHALTLSGAGLSPDKMKLPAAPLRELNLDGNAFESYPYFEQYPDLTTLVLVNNSLTEFDASKLKSLQGLYISDNQLTDITLDNPNLWDLSLERNNLTTIDLSKVKSLEQLSLAQNSMAEIDLTPVRRSLRVLSLMGNRFTFATLPIQAKYPNLMVYYYGRQADVEAIISDDYMKFDLSSQAMVDGINPTVYTWFLGEPVYNSDEGTLSGETLIEGDEYSIENGITTFNVKFEDEVVCVMTNPVFPSMYLRTPKYRVGYSGVETVEAVDANAPVDVYTISGAIVKRQVSRSEALEGLEPGLYIVGGKKIYVR